MQTTVISALNSELSTLRRFVLIPIVSLVLTSCTTVDRSPKTSHPQANPAEKASAGGISVDFEGLERSLGFDRSPIQLGYQEKAFNTCSVGYGYSSTHECRVERMVIVQFHLQCRQSEGTVEYVSPDEIQAVVSDRVRWNLGSLEGQTSTNTEGRGRIRVVTEASPKTRWLRLTVNGKFLAQRAGDLKRVIAPGSWCEKSR